MRIVQKDLLRFYESFQQSGETEIQPTEVNYLDYARRENHRIRSNDFDQDLAYWRGQWMEYGGARLLPPDLPFAIHPPQPANTNFALARLPLGEDLNGAIQRFAREFRCTVHTVFLAGFCILLHQYTGQEKLALWGHFANRLQPETADVVGWFNNTNLVGIDIAPEMSVKRLLSNIRDRLRLGVVHQEMPGPLLWQRLNCSPRSLDVRPLLDTYRQDPPVELSDGMQVECSSLPGVAGGRFSQFGVYVEQNGDEFTLTAQMALAIFSQDSAAGVIQDLTNTMEQLTASRPEQTIAEFRPPQNRANLQANNSSRDEMDEYILRGGRWIPELDH